MTASKIVTKVSGLAPVAAARPPAIDGMDATDAMDDRRLVAEVRAGNPIVADAFCRRVWPQVDRTVQRLLGRDDNESEDASQLAVIELVKTIGAYRGECSLDTWASAVTAHVVYKQLRRRKRGREVSLDVIVEANMPSSGANGERTLAAREVLANVLVHLDAIGEKLAWSFVLHDVLGHGVKEIAQILGVSEVAAQSRLVRGRRRLHKRIADDPELAELLTGMARAAPR